MTTKMSLRSGELARMAGVSTDTLRHYERKGVLAAPRRARNGYREYPPEALERVRLVRRALAVGFTLDELARILKERERGRAPCRQVRALAAAKLTEIELRLDEMLAVRDELKTTLEDWDARLARTKDGQRAGLLEALSSRNSTKGANHSPVNPSWSRKKQRRRRINEDED